MQQRKGTQIIIETLLQEGADIAFGYPGGFVIPLFDELLNYPELKFTLVHHEQAAAHAADGYARISGKPAVVLATSGPGATNTITGIANAALDSIPMIIITGQVRREMIGKDAFQETNMVGVSRPLTKNNYLVKDIENLPKIIKEAFYIAQNGRPGPVLIDIPVDIQQEISDVTNPEKITVRGCPAIPLAQPNQIQEIWEMIQAAYRPVIYAGGGIQQANATQELYSFATQANIPVTTTLTGLGGFPGDHKLSLGMLGMHGTYPANYAMAKTDLAIVFGARFDDRVTGKTDEFLRQAKIIHVDIDPSIINKIKTADLGLAADVKQVLTELNSLVKPLKTELWLNKLQQIQQQHQIDHYVEKSMPENALRPEYIIHQLSNLTQGDATIITDVGQHQMFTALHYTFKRPRSIVTSGGLGTMGFGLPAAMGVTMAQKDQPVILITGDGGFQMNMQEMATIRHYNLPVKILLFHNGNLGMVKQWQDFFWEGRTSHTILTTMPNFAKLADAFDLPYLVTGKKENVSEIIQQALATEGPVFVEFKIDKDAYVYPMIPAGKGIKDVIFG